MRLTRSGVKGHPEQADNPGMFTVYALNLSDPAMDTEAECATLDEALTHLRELVLNELEDPPPVPGEAAV